MIQGRCASVSLFGWVIIRVVSFIPVTPIGYPADLCLLRHESSSKE